MPPRKRNPLDTVGPLVISTDEFANVCRRLLKNQDFQKLRSHWLNIRHGIEQEGKSSKDARLRDVQWGVLDGFDRAVMEPEKWALKVPRNRKQAEVPTSDLEGGSE